jgi:hypothetical protein
VRGESGLTLRSREWLRYPGGIKGEKQLEGEAAFAGGSALYGVCGGFIASCRFYFWLLLLPTMLLMKAAKVVK